MGLGGAGVAMGRLMGGGNAASAANNDYYMLTPCDHLFHEACLQRWMEHKLECPVCRATLPPE